MLKWIVLLSMMVLFGCEGPQDDPTVITQTINPGLYEYQENFSFQGAFIAMEVQARFSKSTLESSTFANTIEFIQEKGSWQIVGNSLQNTGRTIRKINDAGAWGPWEPLPDGRSSARNITSTSFQEFIDFSELTDAQRAQFQGLSSGWKTFNRLSD